MKGRKLTFKAISVIILEVFVLSQFSWANLGSWENISRRIKSLSPSLSPDLEGYVRQLVEESGFLSDPRPWMNLLADIISRDDPMDVIPSQFDDGEGNAIAIEGSSVRDNFALRQLAQIIELVKVPEFQQYVAEMMGKRELDLSRQEDVNAVADIASGWLVMNRVWNTIVNGLKELGFGVKEVSVLDGGIPEVSAIKPLVVESLVNLLSMYPISKLGLIQKVQEAMPELIKVQKAIDELKGNELIGAIDSSDSSYLLPWLYPIIETSLRRGIEIEEAGKEILSIINYVADNPQLAEVAASLLFFEESPSLKLDLSDQIDVNTLAGLALNDMKLTGALSVLGELDQSAKAEWRMLLGLVTQQGANVGVDLVVSKIKEVLSSLGEVKDAIASLIGKGNLSEAKAGDIVYLAPWVYVATDIALGKDISGKEAVRRVGKIIDYIEKFNLTSLAEELFDMKGWKSEKDIGDSDAKVEEINPFTNPADMLLLATLADVLIDVENAIKDEVGDKYVQKDLVTVIEGLLDEGMEVNNLEYLLNAVRGKAQNLATTGLNPKQAEELLKFEIGELFANSAKRYLGADLNIDISSPQDQRLLMQAGELLDKVVAVAEEVFTSKIGEIVGEDGEVLSAWRPLLDNILSAIVTDQTILKTAGQKPGYPTTLEAVAYARSIDLEEMVRNLESLELSKFRKDLEEAITYIEDASSIMSELLGRELSPQKVEDVAYLLPISLVLGVNKVVYDKGPEEVKEAMEFAKDPELQAEVAGLYGEEEIDFENPYHIFSLWAYTDLLKKVTDKASSEREAELPNSSEVSALPEGAGGDPDVPSGFWVKVNRFWKDIKPKVFQAITTAMTLAAGFFAAQAANFKTTNRIVLGMDIVVMMDLIKPIMENTVYGLISMGRDIAGVIRNRGRISETEVRRRRLPEVEEISQGKIPEDQFTIIIKQINITELTKSDVEDLEAFVQPYVANLKGKENGEFFKFVIVDDTLDEGIREEIRTIVHSLQSKYGEDKIFYLHRNPNVAPEWLPIVSIADGLFMGKAGRVYDTLDFLARGNDKPTAYTHPAWDLRKRDKINGKEVLQIRGSHIYVEYKEDGTGIVYEKDGRPIINVNGEPVREKELGFHRFYEVRNDGLYDERGVKIAEEGEYLVDNERGKIEFVFGPRTEWELGYRYIFIDGYLYEAGNSTPIAKAEQINGKYGGLLYDKKTSLLLTDKNGNYLRGNYIGRDFRRDPNENYFDEIIGDMAKIKGKVKNFAVVDIDTQAYDIHKLIGILAHPKNKDVVLLSPRLLVSNEGDTLMTYLDAQGRISMEQIEREDQRMFGGREYGKYVGRAEEFLKAMITPMREALPPNSRCEDLLEASHVVVERAEDVLWSDKPKPTFFQQYGRWGRWREWTIGDMQNLAMLKPLFRRLGFASIPHYAYKQLIEAGWRPPERVSSQAKRTATILRRSLLHTGEFGLYIGMRMILSRMFGLIGVEDILAANIETVAIVVGGLLGIGRVLPAAVHRAAVDGIKGFGEYLKERGKELVISTPLFLYLITSKPGLLFSGYRKNKEAFKTGTGVVERTPGTLISMKAPAITQSILESYRRMKFGTALGIGSILWMLPFGLSNLLFKMIPSISWSIAPLIARATEESQISLVSAVDKVESAWHELAAGVYVKMRSLGLSKPTLLKLSMVGESLHSVSGYGRVRKIRKIMETFGDKIQAEILSHSTAKNREVAMEIWNWLDANGMEKWKESLISRFATNQDARKYFYLYLRTIYKEMIYNQAKRMEELGMGGADVIRIRDQFRELDREWIGIIPPDKEG